MLSSALRKIIPIRKAFCQQGHGRTTVPGPLAQFLTSHDGRGLEAYLHTHAMASASKPHDVVLPSGVWVRVGLLEAPEAERITEESARGVVSKVMRRFAGRNLVERSRRNRAAVITLLDEDGLGKAFEHPMGHERDDRWLPLPTPTGSTDTSST